LPSGQLRVVKRALHAGVLGFDISKSAALGASVGPREHTGKAA